MTNPRGSLLCRCTKLPTCTLKVAKKLMHRQFFIRLILLKKQQFKERSVVFSHQILRRTLIICVKFVSKATNKMFGVLERGKMINEGVIFPFISHIVKKRLVVPWLSSQHSSPPLSTIPWKITNVTSIINVTRTLAPRSKVTHPHISHSNQP